MTPDNREEIRLEGTPISEGIAIGKPLFLLKEEGDTPDFPISHHEVDTEIARFRKAIFSSRKDLQRLQQDLAMEGSDEAVSFIESHIQMLEDPMITTDIEGGIRRRLRNTESVFRSAVYDYTSRFQEADAFFQERLSDVTDLSKRIMGHLQGSSQTDPSSTTSGSSTMPAGSIVITGEVAPTFVASAHAAQIGGFVSKAGGGSSHAALIARAKGIPFVSNVNIDWTEDANITNVIIDGYSGIVIFNPSDATKAEYEQKQQTLKTRYQALLMEDKKPVETKDQQTIAVYVNLGNPQDLAGVSYKHDGVGLLRTEYLFLQTDLPSEEFQLKAYKELLQASADLPVVIRVFDLGGDKHPTLFSVRSHEPNPALGCRGIRFLLRNVQLFKTQLRAILKATCDANVRLLLPMISEVAELIRAKEILEEVRTELKSGMLDVPQIPIGCMIEIPSAVMCIDALAKECDFFSIGTNDLVQYTLAVDRNNPAMSQYYYPAHPSVIRMIDIVLKQAKLEKRPVTLCGEIASNTLFTPMLLGLGLKAFSVSPRYLPLVKQTIRSWSMEEAEELAREVIRLSNPQAVLDLLEERKKDLGL